MIKEFIWVFGSGIYGPSAVSERNYTGHLKVCSYCYDAYFIIILCSSSHMISVVQCKPILIWYLVFNKSNKL